MKQTKIKTELFAQSMSRKEFLRFLVLGVFAVFGINNFMNFLQSQAGQTRSAQVSQKSTGHGFGSSRFGI